MLGGLRRSVDQVAQAPALRAYEIGQDGEVHAFFDRSLLDKFRWDCLAQVQSKKHFATMCASHRRFNYEEAHTKNLTGYDSDPTLAEAIDLRAARDSKKSIATHVATRVETAGPIGT
jgi:hypothetical protein